MPRIESNQTHQCPICFETLDTNKVETACRHAFHQICLNSWLSKENSCPICRKAVMQPSKLISFITEFGKNSAVSHAHAGGSWIFYDSLRKR